MSDQVLTEESGLQSGFFAAAMILFLVWAASNSYATRSLIPRLSSFAETPYLRRVHPFFVQTMLDLLLLVAFIFLAIPSLSASSSYTGSSIFFIGVVFFIGFAVIASIARHDFQIVFKRNYVICVGSLLLSFAIFLFIQLVYQGSSALYLYRASGVLYVGISLIPLLWTSSASFHATDAIRRSSPRSVVKFFDGVHALFPGWLWRWSLSLVPFFVFALAPTTNALVVPTGFDSSRHWALATVCVVEGAMQALGDDLIESQVLLPSFVRFLLVLVGTEYSLLGVVGATLTASSGAFVHYLRDVLPPPRTRDRSALMDKVLDAIRRHDAEANDKIRKSAHATARAQAPPPQAEGDEAEAEGVETQSGAAEVRREAVATEAAGAATEASGSLTVESTATSSSDVAITIEAAGEPKKSDARQALGVIFNFVSNTMRSPITVGILLQSFVAFVLIDAYRSGGSGLISFDRATQVQAAGCLWFMWLTGVSMFVLYRIVERNGLHTTSLEAAPLSPPESSAATGGGASSTSRATDDAAPRADSSGAADAAIPATVDAGGGVAVPDESGAAASDGSTSAASDIQLSEEDLKRHKEWDDIFAKDRARRASATSEEAGVVIVASGNALDGASRSTGDGAGASSASTALDRMRAAAAWTWVMVRRLCADIIPGIANFFTEVGNALRKDMDHPCLVGIVALCVWCMVFWSSVILAVLTDLGLLVPIITLLPLSAWVFWRFLKSWEKRGCPMWTLWGTSRGARTASPPSPPSPPTTGVSYFSHKLTAVKRGVPGETVHDDEIRDKHLMLFFGCKTDPCSEFTRVLMTAYAALKSSRPSDDFEVVFVGYDGNQESFHECLKDAPWLNLPFEEQEMRTALRDFFSVSAFPTLVILGPSVEKESGGAARHRVIINSDAKAGDLSDVSQFPFPAASPGTAAIALVPPTTPRAPPTNRLRDPVIRRALRSWQLSFVLLLTAIVFGCADASNYLGSIYLGLWCFACSATAMTVSRWRSTLELDSPIFALMSLSWIPTIVWSIVQGAITSSSSAHATVVLVLMLATAVQILVFSAFLWKDCTQMALGSQARASTRRLTPKGFLKAILTFAGLLFFTLFIIFAIFVSTPCGIALLMILLMSMFKGFLVLGVVSPPRPGTGFARLQIWLSATKGKVLHFGNTNSKAAGALFFSLLIFSGFLGAVVNQDDAFWWLSFSYHSISLCAFVYGLYDHYTSNPKLYGPYFYPIYTLSESKNSLENVSLKSSFVLISMTLTSLWAVWCSIIIVPSEKGFILFIAMVISISLYVRLVSRGVKVVTNPSVVDAARQEALSKIYDLTFAESTSAVAPPSAAIALSAAAAIAEKLKEQEDAMREFTTLLATHASLTSNMSPLPFHHVAAMTWYGVRYLHYSVAKKLLGPSGAPAAHAAVSAGGASGLQDVRLSVSNSAEAGSGNASRRSCPQPLVSGFNAFVAGIRNAGSLCSAGIRRTPCCRRDIETGQGGRVLSAPVWDVADDAVRSQLIRSHENLFEKVKLINQFHAFYMLKASLEDSIASNIQAAELLAFLREPSLLETHKNSLNVTSGELEEMRSMTPAELLHSFPVDFIAKVMELFKKYKNDLAKLDELKQREEDEKRRDAEKRLAGIRRQALEVKRKALAQRQKEAEEEAARLAMEKLKQMEEELNKLRADEGDARRRILEVMRAAEEERIRKEKERQETMEEVKRHREEMKRIEEEKKKNEERLKRLQEEMEEMKRVEEMKQAQLAAEIRLREREEAMRKEAEARLQLEKERLERIAEEERNRLREQMSIAERLAEEERNRLAAEVERAKEQRRLEEAEKERQRWLAEEARLRAEEEVRRRAAARKLEEANRKIAEEEKEKKRLEEAKKKEDEKKRLLEEEERKRTVVKVGSVGNCVVGRFGEPIDGSLDDLIKKKGADPSKPFTDKDFDVVGDLPNILGSPNVGGGAGWKALRLHEIFGESVKSRPTVLPAVFSPDQISQGQLGDCYFLSAIATVAARKGLLERLQSGPEKLFPESRKDIGLYSVGLYFNGRYRQVVVDDYIVCSGKNPSFARGGGKSKVDSVWIMLLEKAYAKIHGTFAAIEGGFVSSALADLTNGVPGSIDNLTAADTWSKLLMLFEAGHLLGAGSTSGRDTETTTDGIVKGHAYSILDMRLVDGNQLLKLRNPWGSGEWTGAWSDSAPEWTPRLKKLLDVVEADDGAFWISFPDFSRVFRTVYVCRLFENVAEIDGATGAVVKTSGVDFMAGVEAPPPLMYKRIYLEGEWKGETAGGCSNYPTFANNTQYYISASKDCSITVVLSQTEDLEGKSGNELITERNGEKCMGMSVFDKGGKKVVGRGGLSTDRTSYSNKRSLDFDFKVKGGVPLTLVPSLFDAGEENKYNITLYAKVDSKDTTIVFKPL